MEFLIIVEIFFNISPQIGNSPPVLSEGRVRSDTNWNQCHLKS